MKAFKITDCVAQVLMIGMACFLVLFLKPHTVEDAFGFYFAVGGWQILSVCIHLAAGKQYRSQLRKAYHILLLITVGVGILSLVGGSDGVIIFMAILLGWSPILAVLYMIACIKETNRLVVQSKMTNTNQE
jgi:hypothetical protein